MWKLFGRDDCWDQVGPVRVCSRLGQLVLTVCQIKCVKCKESNVKSSGPVAASHTHILLTKHVWYFDINIVSDYQNIFLDICSVTHKCITAQSQHFKKKKKVLGLQQLMTIFIINKSDSYFLDCWLIIWSRKCQQIVKKNALQYFPKNKFTYSNPLFCIQTSKFTIRKPANIYVWGAGIWGNFLLKKKTTKKPNFSNLSQICCWLISCLSALKGALPNFAQCPLYPQYCYILVCNLNVLKCN